MKTASIVSPLLFCTFAAFLGSGRAQADAPVAGKSSLTIPAGTKFINGTGQLPVNGNTFKAPGFTSQGYLEVCEDAGPTVNFIGLNFSEATLTIKSSYKTDHLAPLTRITYATRNKELGLTCGPDETRVAPYEFYVSDAMPLTVKAGQRLILRNFVPLDNDTTIGCGIISGSEQRSDGRWPYGNVIGEKDRTLDPELEADWKTSSDLLCVPAFMVGQGVREDARFVVAFGDSLTFQLTKDKDGPWFQYAFQDVPHANVAVGGDALNNLFTPEGNLTSPLQECRFQLAQYATDVLNFYGHNDIGNGQTAEGMLKLDRIFCARPEIKSIRKWRCTLTPFTRNMPGVDPAKLEDADQTPDKTSGEIIAFNKAVRKDYRDLGYAGILEIGGTLARGEDSPYWKPSMAPDGTHFGKVPANELLKPVVRTLLDAPATR